MTLATLAQLRSEARELIRTKLKDAQLVRPTTADETIVRRILEDVVEQHRRRSTLQGESGLSWPDDAIVQNLFDHLLRLGPLQPLIDDPSVEEVLVDGPDRVFVIEGGRKRLTSVFFAGDEELRHVIRRLVDPTGRRLDETHPLVDARLPDGTRLHAAIPPVTPRHPVLTLRKFLLPATTLDDLVKLRTLSREAADFLRAAVRAGLNVLVSGGTASGKTTTLNALGACLADTDERLILIEETAELRLPDQLPDCIGLEARFANVEGEGQIPIRELVRNALRMRPTRIVVGEVRGPEALDMLLAMNSGHDGSMGTIHANDPRAALAKLRTYVLMGGEGLPAAAVTSMIAETIDLVVHQRLERGTSRRVIQQIFEVTGLDGDIVCGQDLFARRDGGLEQTGIRPRCLERLLDVGWPNASILGIDLEPVRHVAGNGPFRLAR